MRNNFAQESEMSPIAVILVILLVLIIAGYPGFGLHSYGYGPTGLLTAVLVIVLVFMLLGRV